MNDEDGIWVARDADGAEIQLDRIGRTGEWQLSVTMGRFSGYPSVDITREQLAKLGAVIAMELMSTSNKKDPDLLEMDRMARAYGFEIGRGQRLTESVQTQGDNPFLDPNWREKIDRSNDKKD